MIGYRGVSRYMLVLRTYDRGWGLFPLGLGFAVVLDTPVRQIATMSSLYPRSPLSATRNHYTMTSRDVLY